MSMRVLILRDTVANKQAVFAGQVVDVLPESDALLLIAMGKAREAAAADVMPVFVAPEVGKGEAETADLKVSEIESSVRRGKRKE
jgi:hypothetical protein